MHGSKKAEPMNIKKEPPVEKYIWVCQQYIKQRRYPKMGNNSLAHRKWNCKYHLVFVPKYRRLVIYGKIKEDIGKILRKLWEQKGVEIIEVEACKNHIHMLGSIPQKISI